MISTADVAVSLGRPQPLVDSSERLQWDMWIRDARLLIKDRLGDLDALDQDALDYVVREAVAARVRRPDEATQVDISIDDGRVSRMYQKSTGTVNIRPEWWDMLSPDSGSQAFSIGPVGHCW